ncbi:MAG: gamma-glutamyl-gamma-aminobutyrate hydrolase family protein [Candidatus Saccharibacteria bacterium]
MQPLIGITGAFDQSEEKYYLRSSYVAAVERAGGVPAVIPYVCTSEAVTAYVRSCDGFVFSGGGDIDPSFWLEEPQPGLGEVDPWRDLFEITLAREVLVSDKPALFICRGIQLLNVVLGGDVVQDICTNIQHQQRAPRYHPSHDVLLEPQSRLFRLIHQPVVRVNSFHHQALGRIGDDLYIAARSRDGLVEAVEHTASRFVLGVQWHPEAMKDELSARLFSTLVEMAAPPLKNAQIRVTG